MTHLHPLKCWRMSYITVIYVECNKEEKKDILNTASTSRFSLSLSVNHIQHHAAGLVFFAFINPFFQNFKIKNGFFQKRLSVAGVHATFLPLRRLYSFVIANDLAKESK